MNTGHDVKKKFRPDSLPHSENANFTADAAMRGVAHQSDASSSRSVSRMPSRSAIRVVSLLLCAASAAAAGDAVAQLRGAVRDVGDRVAPRADVRTVPPRAERRGHDRNDEQRALSAAVRRVESQTGGQVLSAERIPFDGRDVSRIKVVDASGRVRVYMDDPRASRGRSDASPQRPRTRDDDN